VVENSDQGWGFLESELKLENAKGQGTFHCGEPTPEILEDFRQLLGPVD
jgi:hypothetical protein